MVRDNVRFVRDGAAGLEAAYDITFSIGSAPRLSVPDDRTLTDAEKAALNKSADAVRGLIDACKKLEPKLN